MKKTPKLKKLKKPKLPKRLERAINNAKPTEEKVDAALSNVPRITNETVAEHREEVLSGARKNIIPLQHSKHRVVRISVGLFVAVVVFFFAYCGLALYKFQSTSGFIYDVTRVIPFPVAKAGNAWVSYESYLFELRRNMHYYTTQQQTNFESRDGQTQLKRLKQQTMDHVVLDAYVKQLADQNGVSVTNQAVDNQVELVRRENRLGNNDRVFKEVLKEFWGWSEADFKRELKQQLLQQAVVAKLDKDTNQRALAALNQVKGGADFAAVAKQLSEDTLTKDNGGQYPDPITANDHNIPPAMASALFKLDANQVSDIINSGYTLDILKVVEVSGTSRRAAHIQFNLKDINTFVKPYRDDHPSRSYINIR